MGRIQVIIDLKPDAKDDIGATTKVQHGNEETLITLTTSPRSLYGFTTEYRRQRNLSAISRVTRAADFKFEQFKNIMAGVFFHNNGETEIHQVDLALELIYHAMPTGASTDRLVSILKQIYPTLEKLGGLDDQLFVTEAMRLTQSAVPYRLASESVRCDVMVASVAACLVHPQRDFPSGLFSNKVFILNACRRDASILQKADDTLLRDNRLMLNALIFGNWKFVAKDRSKMESLQEVIGANGRPDIYHNLFYMQTGRELVDIHRSYKIFLQSKNRVRSFAEKYKDNFVLELVKAELAAYAPQTSFTKIFDHMGSNKHHRKPVTDQLHSLECLRAEASDLEQFDAAVRVIGDLSRETEDKGVGGDLNTRLMLLLIELTQYARQRIESEPVFEARPAIGTGGDAAAAEGYSANSETWEQAYKKLLEVKLTFRSEGFTEQAVWPRPVETVRDHHWDYVNIGP